MLDIKDKEIFLQNIDVLVANATPANTLNELSVQANRDYNKIIGIGWFELEDGGISNDYLVGFRTNRKTWINAIPATAWTAGQGVGPMLKYYEVNIPFGSGDTLYAIINNNALLTADLVGTMVLILAKDLTEVPK
jgi:hypothetical protein